MYLHDAHVSNVVTSFALLWSGIIVSVFWFLDSKQPIRWLLFYSTVIITAIPTIIHHMYPKSVTWTSVDIMSNILLIWAMNVAFAWDFLRGKVFKIFIFTITLFNLLVFIYLFLSVFLPQTMQFIHISKQHGFTPGEIALIINAFVVVALITLHAKTLTTKQRQVMVLVVLIFLFGFILATGDDNYIYPPFMAWHSLWHITGAFGFIVIWYFNHLRFSIEGDKNHVNS